MPTAQAILFIALITTNLVTIIGTGIEYRRINKRFAELYK